MLETTGCGLVSDTAAANRIDTAMKFHQLMIAAALPLAFVACKESEVEKAKADVKATADEAMDKTKAAAEDAKKAMEETAEKAKAAADDAKAAASDAAAKAKDAAANAAEKASDAAEDAADKLREE
jgi:hypothetical protein